jgi:hypothetical protein
MHDVVVVFFFVGFPHFAKLFAEGLHFGVDFWALLGFGGDFSSSQEIVKSATDTTFTAKKRQVN